MLSTLARPLVNSSIQVLLQTKKIFQIKTLILELQTLKNIRLLVILAVTLLLVSGIWVVSFLISFYKIIHLIMSQDVGVFDPDLVISLILLLLTSILLGLICLEKNWLKASHLTNEIAQIGHPSQQTSGTISHWSEKQLSFFIQKIIEERMVNIDKK